MTKRLITVRINRKRWLRGTEDSTLRTYDGKKQCCLGFVCRAAGLSAQSIAGMGTPGDVDQENLEPLFARSPLLKTLLTLDAADDYFGSSFSEKEIVSDAVAVNDDLTMEDSEREKRLVAMFLKRGVRLEFFG